MPNQSRAAQVDLSTTPYYHCVSRCVRRAFLCGEDPYTGQSYEHRKGWIVAALRGLSASFAVDVCAYAVMSNHFHVVVRVDAERAAAWSEDEVLARYGKRFKNAKAQLEGLPDEARAERVALFRARLSDLSWMMRVLNESIARRANREDECTGRFWEGRFKSQPLLDEAGLITCMAYVDLNPVRAGVCARLDDAEFTSIEARLKEAARRMDVEPTADAAPADAAADAAADGATSPPGLAPFADQAAGLAEPAAESDAPIPMTFADYVELLEWTGRAVREGAGRLRGAPPAVMQRLGIEPERWTRTMSSHGLRTLAFLGRAEELEALAARQDKRWVKGQRWARELFRDAA